MMARPNIGQISTMSSIERAEKAVALRRAGVSYPKIAERLGYHDKSAAFNAIKLQLHRMVNSEDAQELRSMETLRLDELQTAHWNLAMRGDVKATQVVLSIIDRRAKLHGLDLNEARMAGALEVAAVAEIAQVSMLQAHLVGAMNDAAVPLELQDAVIAALNTRLLSDRQGDLVETTAEVADHEVE